MQLIPSLISGVRGAELGTAQLFRRGTSTRAIWYSSFEGDGANSTGADITLDSNGGATVYINELVNVIVKDTDGTTIREFVAGESAAAVEVISDSFTGTDYVSAISAVNKPTTLLEILNKWNDSAGATDFNVAVNGSPVTLEQAVSGNIYVNVQSALFGAVGDGVTDDTAAINAAIDYANSLGDVTVYFPPGVYLTTASINVKTNVSMMGAHFSYLKRNSSNFSLLTFDAGGTYTVSKLGLIDVSTGSNAAICSVPATATVWIRECEIKDLGITGTNSPVLSATAGNVYFVDSTIFLSGPGGCIAPRSGGGLTQETRLHGCLVGWFGSTTFTTTTVTGVVTVVGSKFQMNCGAANQPPAIFSIYTPSAIIGNRFTTTLASTELVVVFDVDGSVGATAENGIVEAANQMAENFVYLSANTPYLNSLSREMRSKSYTIGAPGTVTLFQSYGLAVVVGSGIAGTYTLSFPSGAPRNSIIDLIYRNTSANNHTLATANTSPVDTGVAVNAGQILRARWVYTTVGATTTWWRETGLTVTVL